MQKFIVITTINKITEAIKKYDNKKDWNLIVVGDKKTPSIKLKNGIFLTLSDQKKLGFKCEKNIPINCYQRLNIGYLFALKNGAEMIASIDDDNIPLKNWGKDVSVNKKIKSKFLTSSNKFVDILYAHKNVTKKNIWHRGFPINELENRTKQKISYKKNCVIDVEAGLWNTDPDVDAICRISNGPFNLKFNKKNFVIDNKCYSPFDTQNIIFSKRILPSMCILFDVGRMCDIWASFITQRIMRELNSYLLFTGPTVNHVRNKHNLTHDLFDEILGLKHTTELIHLLNNIKFKRNDNVLTMYKTIVDKISKLKFINSKKTKLVFLFSESESNYNKSYRKIIHIEGLLIQIYYLLAVPDEEIDRHKEE